MPVCEHRPPQDNPKTLNTQLYIQLYEKKLARFRQFAALYPECYWLFVGDNGQVWASPLLTVFCPRTDPLDHRLPSGGFWGCMRALVLASCAGAARRAALAATLCRGIFREERQKGSKGGMHHWCTWRLVDVLIRPVK